MVCTAESRLSRSTAKLTESVVSLLHKRRLDEEALEELEETLITADLGVAASRRIVEGFRRTRFGKEVTDEEVKAALADEIATILEPVAQPLVIEPARAPHLVLVVGVNGKFRRLCRNRLRGFRPASGPRLAARAAR